MSRQHLRLPLAIAISALPTISLAHEDSAAILLPKITVSAAPLGQHSEAMSTPYNVVPEQKIFEQGGNTLGDALKGELGVSADNFGGGASRPIIRGHGGARIKVLSDSSNLLDASEVSPDHAVTSEPLLASRIEVLRGPAALLYGGGAIGGVVNVVDRKVPQFMPKNGLEGFVGGRVGSVANEKAGVVSLTAAASESVAVHFEGSTRTADDYQVPDFHDKRVEGSFADAHNASVGASWILPQGYFGLAFTERRDEYGLPGHSHSHSGCELHGNHLHCPNGHGSHAGHSHAPGSGHANEHGIPLVDLQTQRWDLRGEYLEPISGINRLRLRASQTRYQHDEIEEGHVATTFKNDGYDFRLEAEHYPMGDWKGMAGIQHSHSDFEAIGEERYMPSAKTTNTGIFLLEHYDINAFMHMELGARHEWQTVKAEGHRASSDLNATSLSAAGVWHFADGYDASVSVTRSQRLPSAQELFANGVHVATSTFEVGNPNLKRETANNVELSVKKTEGDITFAANLYYNLIDNYTFAETLDEEDDLRLIAYTQNDAEFYGAEAEVTRAFGEHFKATVFGDAVRATLKSGENLPRIPAHRFGVRFQQEWNIVSAELEAYRVDKQTEIGRFETQTPAYNMLNLTLSHQGQVNQQPYSVYLRANNLLNELAYNHTSFIKDESPFAGRNISAGFKLSF